MRDRVHIFNGVAVTLQLVNDEIDIYHIGSLEDGRMCWGCFAVRFIEGLKELWALDKEGGSRFARTAHLSDDEAVTKMGHVPLTHPA